MPPPKETAATARGWTLPRSLLLAISGMVFIAFTALTVILLWQKRTDTIGLAVKRTQNLTRTLEEQMARRVAEIDLELSAVSRSLDRLPVPLPLANGQIRSALQATAGPEAEYRDIAVIDADGRLIADAMGGTSIDVSDRDFFTAPRIGSAADLYISRSALTRDGKEWPLVLSRRLSKADGSFAGIVAAFVSLDRFREFYASLDVGRGGAVALWDGTAGRLLARHPDRPELLDLPLDRGPLFEALGGGRDEGVLRGRSPIDGIDRIASFRRVAGLPFIVVVALDLREVLATWYRDAWLYGSGVAIASIMLLLLTAALLKQLSRQDALVAALQTSEAAASQLNRRFEDAINSLSVSFSLFDAEDRLVIGNRTRMALSDSAPGITFQTLTQHAAANLIHAESLGDDPAAWVQWRVERHRNPDGPIELRYRDGSWVRIHETRTREGGTVVTRTDITQLKEIEGSLRASEERFRDYAETASEWYWDTDCEHRVSYLSEPTAGFVDDPGHLNGPDAIMTLGRRRADITLDNVAADPKWQEHFRQLERREPFTDFTFRVASSNGKERYACVSGKPIFDAQGLFLGYRGTGRDVTQQIVAAARLREAKAAAEAANRAKSEFLAAMSHELRTPLNAVIGFSELIRDVHYAKDPARVRAYAADIHASGQHLLKVINDILEVSRIEAGKLELHEEAIDLAAAVEACLTLVRQCAAENAVALRCDVPDDLPRLLADATRLKQILLNLLSNAVKFTPGGGSVTVEARMAEDAGLVISVRDDGIGMTADEIVVALQPFRQVDNSLSRRFEGTGLGLPLTKAFTELHGGRLEVVSVPGEGTTVRVTFPPGRIVLASARTVKAKAS